MSQKTYSYARLSKDSDKSMSIWDQRRKIEAYAVATDRTITEHFEDAGESGRDMERPAVQRLLSLVRPGDTILVYRLDRLTRSLGDLCSLLERGVNLCSVTESLDTSSASGKLVVNILGAVAQWERETIAERTANALAARRSAGRVYGRIPYGYRRDGDAIVGDEREQEALAAIRAWRSDGVRVAEITRRLNRDYLAVARGARWHEAAVRSIAVA